MRAKYGKSAEVNGPGELALLKRIRRRSERLVSGAVQLGIGDDCALLRLRAGEELAITTDLSIEGRHFRLDWHPPDAVGHRTLARGLSDLAAMGARPVSAFLSLGLPRNLTMSTTRRPAWVDRFLNGFLALADTLQIPLAGGDLAESPIVVADIVLVGAVPRGKALLRSGARAGDLLYVTGSLGGAAASLARLGQLASAAGIPAKPPYLSTTNKALLAPHLYPQPRIAQGLWLRRRSRATAALDLSDGLSTDLGHLCQESGTVAEVNLAALPVHSAATVSQALHGGEDYELLFTASPADRIPRTIAGVPVTPLGRMLPSRPGRTLVTLLTPNGPQLLEASGWQHFS